MNKRVLYQINNAKSSRRLIDLGYGKFRWSEGEGEDGTFLTGPQLQFILDSYKELYQSDVTFIKYDIEEIFAYPEQELTGVNYEADELAPF